MSKVRTRFAPSPTGRMHVGNLRTALYAYLVAKHEGGDFILRIEDTDQERYVEGAVDIIYRTLQKTGLIHDEGPDKDGGCGPYVQSERQASGLYLKYAQQLIEQGDAYYCFCDKERLESLKTQVSESGVEPCRADDDRFGAIPHDGFFACQFGAAVCRSRACRFLLAVGNVCSPVEHVVRRNLYHAAAPFMHGLGQIARGCMVQQVAERFVAFRFVYGRVSRTVHDTVNFVHADE